MGSVRTLLAISVVFTHSYGVVFVGGRLAVQLFYVISGFLISYIIVEAKSYQNISAFYLNRFLRLFPIYWLVATVTLFAVVFVSIFSSIPSISSTFYSLDLLGKLCLTLSNIFIFGQDWIMFTAVRDGSFQLSTNFRESEIQVWQGLLVPQAWTLGVELSFYLIAPFVLSRTRLMLFLLFSSLLLRGYLINIGLGFQDPWTHRFFPTELALFLLGACSHQFLKPLYEKNSLVTNKSVLIVTIGVFLYCCVNFLLPSNIHTILLFAVFILCLPYLFAFQNNRNWDRKIGDLSYPIYISHILVIWTVEFLLSKLGWSHRTLYGAFVIVMATVALSYLINFLLGRVVEKYRYKIKSQQTNTR